MVVGVGGAENAFYQGGSVFSLLGSLPFNLAFASSIIPAFLYSYNSRVNNKPLCTFEQPAFLGLIIITYTTFFFSIADGAFDIQFLKFQYSPMTNILIDTKLYINLICISYFS